MKLNIKFDDIIASANTQISLKQLSDFDPYKAKDELVYLNRKIRAYFQKANNLKARYDDSNQTLYLGNNTCVFAPTRRTKERLVLAALFKKTNKELSLSSVWTAMGMSDYSKKENWRQAYGTLARINQKVRADLGVEKLIDFNSIKARINPKYI